MYPHNLNPWTIFTNFPTFLGARDICFAYCVLFTHDVVFDILLNLDRPSPAKEMLGLYLTKSQLYPSSQRTKSPLLKITGKTIPIPHHHNTSLFPQRDINDPTTRALVAANSNKSSGFGLNPSFASIVRERKAKEHVRPSGASDGSEPEHRVVHVPGRVDDLHPHPLLLVDHRTLRPQLLTRHGLDHRPPPPLLGNPSLFYFGRFDLNFDFDFNSVLFCLIRWPRV